ncbi:MAG: DUF6502 family protein [Xanthomonadales bacterium]|nr:DUF6502 family protein [Xanthomonadales bacterium]
MTCVVTQSELVAVPAPSIAMQRALPPGAPAGAITFASAPSNGLQERLKRLRGPGRELLSSPLSNHANLNEDAQVLRDMIARVVRNLVRLVIGTISFPAFVDLVRTVFVEEAEKKLKRDGQRPTKSAMALLTGLDTRVVSSVLQESLQPKKEMEVFNPEHALLDMWGTDPLFQDSKTGKPAILPIEGKGKTFQGLVLKAIGRNITVKTVLDRLVASGNVKVISGSTQQVELLSAFYSPISSNRANLTNIAFLESSRVMSAVIHNINSEPEYRVPQQGRWTYRLSPKNYKEFRKRARELLNKQIKEGEELLEEFEDDKKQPGQITVGFGWYQWGGHESSEEGD